MRSVLVVPQRGTSRNGQPARSASEVLQLVTLLLERGGVAVDDYSDHLWTREQIESGAVITGLHFFDFRTYQELHRP